MSTAQHTPGPWYVQTGEQYDDPECGEFRYDYNIRSASIGYPPKGRDNGRLIANIDLVARCYPESEVIANAFMISAAPDLMEACERALGILEHCVAIELAPSAWERADGQPYTPDPTDEGPKWESEGGEHPLVPFLRAAIKKARGDQ